MFTHSIYLASPFNLFDGLDGIVIIFIGLLLFGNRLPSLGKSIGQTIVNFKKGLKETENEIDSAAASETPAQPAQPTQPAAPKRITASNPYSQNMPAATTPAANRKSKMISQSSEEI